MGNRVDSRRYVSRGMFEHLKQSNEMLRNTIEHKDKSIVELRGQLAMLTKRVDAAETDLTHSAKEISAAYKAVQAEKQHPKRLSRVTRLVVIEGETDWVERTLDMSLPLGITAMTRDNRIIVSEATHERHQLASVLTSRQAREDDRIKGA